MHTYAVCVHYSGLFIIMNASPVSWWACWNKWGRIPGRDSELNNIWSRWSPDSAHSIIRQVLFLCPSGWLKLDNNITYVWMTRREKKMLKIPWSITDLEPGLDGFFLIIIIMSCQTRSSRGSGNKSRLMVKEWKNLCMRTLHHARIFMVVLNLIGIRLSWQDRC